MAQPKVTIKVVVEGGDGEKVVRQLTDAFEQAEKAANQVSKTASKIGDKTDESSVKRLKDAFEKTGEAAREAGKSSEKIGSKNDGEKNVRRLKDAFEQTEAAARRAAQASSSIGDKDVFARAAQTSKQFLNEIINTGGMRQYQEVLRNFAPELRTLQEHLKQGSFNQEDFNRRVASLPPLVQRALRDVSGLGQGIKAFGQEAEHGANGFQAMLIKADLAGRAISIATNAITEGFQEYRNFGKEISNLDTLLDDNTSIEKYRKDLLSLNPNLGQTSELARGMYQAISSGVEAGDSLQFITDSAKAARAGMASTFETVDAGTSVMASFGLQGKDISSIYDKMFETVKRGKVEMPQLAQSIGLVTNVAAQTGVTIDEMFAAIATSSRTTRPAQAIEGFRQALVNIIKPSQEAVDVAERLGIAFDADTLKRKGFVQFLNDVTTAAKGNKHDLATLFGDVQALSFVLSITGNNAKQLASDLDGMGKSAGNVDAAFAKQQQSLDAQLTNFKNSILQGFTKAFTVAEPVIKFVVSALNYLLPVIVAVTVAAVGLKLAWMLLTTEFSATAVIGNAIAALELLYEAMLTVIAGEATMGATLAVATGGLSLLAAGVGLALYAYYNMETAIDKANKITLDSINTNAQSLQSYQALAVETQNLAAAATQTSQAQTQNGDVHDRLNAILGRLDPATETYIKSLGNEKQQIDLTTEAVQQNIEVQKALLEAKLRTAADAVIVAQRQLTAENNAVTSRQQAIQELTNHLQLLKQKQQEFDNVPGFQGYQQEILETENRLRGLVQGNLNASDSTGTFTKTIQDNIIKVLQSAQGLQLNNDQLREFFTRAGYSEAQVQLLTAAYQRATNASNNAANGVNKTTDAVNDQTNAVFNLRKELEKLSGAYQEKIDRKTLEIVQNAKDKGEAARLAKEALKNDSDLKKAVDETKRLREAQKAAEDVFSPSERSASGGSSRRKTSQNLMQSIGEDWIKWNPRKLSLNQSVILREKLQQLANQQATQIVLETIRTAEGGQKPNIVYGGKTPQYAPNLDQHPGKLGMGAPGPKGWSTASGLYQITETNWKWIAKILGSEKFSVENQKLGALLVMMQQGNKGFQSLAKGDIEGAIKKGTQPWASSKFSTLPGGKRDYLAIAASLNGKELQQFATETDEERNAKRIIELRERINTIQASGLNDARLKQDVEISQLELAKRETEEILKVRQELNYQIDAELPKNADDRAETLRVLQEYKRNAEQIKSGIRDFNSKIVEQGFSKGVGTIEISSPDDAKQVLDQINTLNKTLDNFTQLREQAGQQIAELAAEFDDGLSPLEKFDLQVRQLAESGKFSAEMLDQTLNPILNQTREELEKAANAEWAKKLRSDTKAVIVSFDEMAMNFSQQIDELNQTEDIKPFAGFLDQIKQIKEIDLPTESFSELRQLISPDGIDVEKLAGVARAWLEISAAIGGTDPAKIDEIIAKLTGAATKFNELNQAQKDKKNADDFKSLKENLDGEYEQLMRNGRELTVYEQTLKDLDTTYKNLSESERNELLMKAQQIDAQKQYNEQYAKTYDFIRSSLDILTDSGKSFGDKMKEIFGGIFNSFKKMILDITAQWLTSKLVGGQNGGSSSGGGSGGIFDSIKKWLHIGSASPNGSGNLGSAQPSGAPALAQGWRPEGYTGTPLGQLTPDRIAETVGIPKEYLNGGRSGSGSGGILSNLKGMFGPQKNVLTGKTSAMAGKMGGIGAIAALVGGFLPGKLGSVVSMAGTGMSIGANFGPWGAAIGAGIGALIGLFGGDPKKKKDKQENIPALQQGFTDAFQQFQQLIADTKSLRTDPDGALAKAAELRASISSGFGIQFLSKKYQKESQKQIALKLGEIDRRPGGLMEQLQIAADIARSANARFGQMKPEFATGAYMSPQFLKQFGDFKKRNGMLSGAFTGRDTLPSMLAQGEMVLNPTQIQRIKAASGFDPFPHAQIPGYAGGTYVAPSVPPAPASFSSPAQNNQAQNSNATIVIEKLQINVSSLIGTQDASEMFVTGAKTDAGERVLVNKLEFIKRNSVKN